MEVILLEKMRNLGALGDKVKVKSGFARNYLVPQGKAVYATKDNMVKFEARRAELEKAAAAKYQEIVAKQERLNKMAPITITAKAGEEGKLFGSVGTRDIADAITKAGEHVEKSEIRLSEGALRFLGEFEIVVELDNDLTATVKLNITPEA